MVMEILIPTAAIRNPNPGKIRFMRSIRPLQTGTGNDWNA